MSLTNNALEAWRWWETARDDLQVAETLEKSGWHSHACFHCQQCGEKALKSLWYSNDADPWGHSIKKLVSDFSRQDWLQPIDQWLSCAALLDKFYIPTRYPNGLPDLTPAQSYTAEEAQMALERATFLLEQVRELLPSK